ncbi:MAG: tetratricopeptide repeat-containing sensor histidine kinase, partial [Deltaproteobacteria bacterium]|nr:tetratricopeptide repeat-containing sensor histidine kinase [Deltaproteobacteria bacterium]
AADAADAAGDPEAALDLIAIAAAHAAGNDAIVLTERVAELAARTGDVERALALYPKVVSAVGVDADTRIRAALAQAELERRRGRADVAHGVLMQALAAARAERRPNAEARCHLRIGWVLMYRADYKAATEHAIAGLVIDAKRALDLLDDALTDASATDDAKLRAGVLHEIGRASIHAGDYARAQTALEAAIAAADDAGDVEQRAKSLNNYGAASYFRGDWPRARRAWEQFRQLCERMGDHAEMLFALNNLGALYRELGMLADARAALDRAADVAADTGQGHIAAMVLANRGEVEMRDGDLAGARERYERALVEFVRLGAKADVIETRRRLCELDLVVGRIDEALSRAIDTARDARDAGIKLGWFLDRAKELLTPLDAKYELGKVAAEEAELLREAGDDSAADAALAAAETIFGQLSARWDLDRVRARRAPRAPIDPTGGPSAAFWAELLRDVGGADVERLLARALDRILAASGYERGFVLLLDNDGRPREHLRRTRPGVRTFDRGDAEFSGTIARRVAASGQAAAVGDAALDADLREQRSVIALGLRRIMCAPLRVGGRVIGIVYVDSSQIAVEDRGLDLAALDAVAGPLALAIENARLVADSKHKTELMSILAHEIRNPLAGILGYSEMGADPEFAGELGDARELLGRIRHDAERLRRLVDNVLELARHESDNVDWSMSAVDVGALAADVAENYRPVCEKKRIALTVLGRDDAGAAIGNTDRLAQVLSNLLGNAVKFTPEGGAITITVRREAVRVDDPNAPPIPATEVRAWVPGADDDVVGEFVRVDVSDTGPGMTPELRAHLFEKFTQGGGSKRTGGIGLGLYISREIVRRHSGTIWVESELGKGAVFSVRLPVAL